MILDPAIDAQKREIKIQEITRDTVGGMDAESVAIGIDPILFIVDKERISKFIAEIGNVCAQPVAPKLSASDISSNSATISMSSEYENAAILYAIRYRKSAGNDDEKEEEWKEQQFE